VSLGVLGVEPEKGKKGKYERSVKCAQQRRSKGGGDPRRKNRRHTPKRDRRIGTALGTEGGQH